jgi:hypothetical protein
MATLVLLINGVTTKGFGGSLSPTGANLNIPDGGILSWRSMFGPGPKVGDEAQLLQYGAAEALIEPWELNGTRMLKVQIESPNWADMHRLIQHATAYTGGHVVRLGEKSNDSSFVRGVANDVRHLCGKIRAYATSLRKKIRLRIAI